MITDEWRVNRHRCLTLISVLALSTVASGEMLKELFIYLFGQDGYLVNAVNLSWSYITILGMPNTVLDNSTPSSSWLMAWLKRHSRISQRYSRFEDIHYIMERSVDSQKPRLNLGNP